MLFNTVLNSGAIEKPGSINTIGRKVGLSFCSEYQAVYDEFTTKPSASIAAAQNTLVSSLVDADIWDEFDIFYLLGGNTNGNSESLLNWINTATFIASIVNSGDVSFEANKGFTSGGTNGYITTGYNPSSDATKYTLNSAMMGMYVQDVGISGAFDAGVNDGTNAVRLSYAIGSIYDRMYINNGLYSVGITTEETGVKCINRSSSTNIVHYVNGTKTAGSKLSNGIPNGDVYILTDNLSGSPQTPTQRQASCFFMGGSLTDAQHIILANALNVFF